MQTSMDLSTPVVVSPAPRSKSLISPGHVTPHQHCNSARRSPQPVREYVKAWACEDAPQRHTSRALAVCCKAGNVMPHCFTTAQCNKLILSWPHSRTDPARFAGPAAYRTLPCASLHMRLPQAEQNKALSGQRTQGQILHAVSVTPTVAMPLGQVLLAQQGHPCRGRTRPATRAAEGLHRRRAPPGAARAGGSRGGTPPGSAGTARAPCRSHCCPRTRRRRAPGCARHSAPTVRIVLDGRRREMGKEYGIAERFIYCECIA